MFSVTTYAQSVPADSTVADEEATPAEAVAAADTIPSPKSDYQPSAQPNYRQPDRYGDPFSNPPPRTPLYPRTPTQLETDISIDSTVNYSIYERINGLDYRAPSYLNIDQYQQYQNRRALQDYWRSRSSALDGESAVSGKQLIPPIYTTPIFDRLFGGSFVDIRPNGFVTLDFGGRFQRVENPEIPIRQQRNGNFEFDQQISLNVVGKIGEKLAVTANFDNNNSFDFQNNIKVEYTGYDHEIIKKIEIGNVNLPVNNSLITGSQSLFGFKTQLQFGRLFVTNVASVQRGSSDAVTIENGSQSREFELRASEYDENRHFFLGQFFRNNYEEWLRALPQVNSLLNVTRVEVYVVNRTGNTQTLRTVAAFMDLGEGLAATIYRDDAVTGNGSAPTANGANNLFNTIKNFDRTPDGLQANIDRQYGSFVSSTDYELKTSVRKLGEDEYTFNSELGYVTLNRQLQNDEMLAVAYEYTYQGQRYQVGELTEDYQNLNDDAAIFLKLLRPTKINISVPTWDLMMKNVYSLNANQITQEGFQLRVIYRDDRAGIDNPSLNEGPDNVRDQQLIRLLGLDRLNQNNDPTNEGDGNFDFVEKFTIDPEQGVVFFPTLQPFGSRLATLFGDNENLKERYVYNELYTSTRADAALVTNKDKFFLVGSFLAGSANEIMLPGINIAEGSVQVTAGNTPLTEGSDFTVDYNLGRVTILNDGVLSSGKEIRVTYEKADLFNFQQRTLLGTRLDYKVNDDINFGATLLHLNERPVITRPSIGDEPTRNTKYGFDVNYRKESRLLTKLVDALPLIQTKEPSSVAVSAEFAQLLPGTSNVVNGDGTSYIDDFENFATPYALSGWQNWQLSAAPQVNGRPIFEEAGLPGRLGRGARRAKLAWYVVDNSVFYLNRSGLKPSGVSSTIKNHYERPIIPQEVFPQQSEQVINTNLPIFDMAYFPEERGPYNYTGNVEEDGSLTEDPRNNWGGITRAITSDVDFDKTNIEYIEFWLLDPFIGGENGVVKDGRVNRNNTTGGKLVFNLGSVSEDVTPDNRHFFENGLPEEYESDNVVVNPEGRAPKDQLLVESFVNTSDIVRDNQDTGFDGVKDGEGQQTELDFFYNGRAVPDAVRADPSADNFRYYLDESYDNREATIVERYKDFNGPENNTPFGSSNERYTPSSSNEPDNEDLNRDNTLSTLEEYYEYEVDLRPGQLEVGRGYIVDKINPTQEPEATWYLFRIPIRQPDRQEGDIQGYKTIRYLRTYLTDFAEPVVLRFAKFQFVGSQWRRFTNDLNDKILKEYDEDYDPGFTISTVNIEENGTSDANSSGSPYRVPPGFIRDRDNTSPINRRLNEQSIQLCVEDLRDGDARAAFKNIPLDLINYGNLRLFLHAEPQEGRVLADSAMSGFVRLGNDATRNYYEVEIPLAVSPPGVSGERDVWPEANDMDIELEWLHELKAERNRRNFSKDLEFERRIGKYRVRIVGSPDLNNIQVTMIGMRNPRSPDRAPQSVCLWANELRVGDFNRQGGWAVNARLNTQLADFANVTASIQHSTFGFGALQSKISDRTREETTAYDISANVNLDKFFPTKFGLQIPMFVSLERERITPQYDPRNEDIPLESTLNAIEIAEGAEARADYLDVVSGQRTQRSLNFTNVRKVKTNEEAKNRFYDLSNFTFSYLYSEEVASSFEIADFQRRLIRGGVGYSYSFPDLTVEPFANVGFLSSPWLALIKDFNFSPAPTSVNVRADISRSFVKSQYRNNELTTFNSDPQFQKTFTFDRIYDLQWNLTRNLSLDYNARALALIDEPENDIEGAIDTQVERDYILEELKRFGRIKAFDQSVTATYTVPLDKIPLTDWLNADVRYGANYSWQAGPYNPNPEVNPLEPDAPAINPIDTVGNTIQNNRDRSLNGKIDMMGLYNKIKFLKDINSTTGGRGRPARRPVPVPNENDTTQQEEKPVRDLKALKGFFRVLMSLRSINVTYTLNEGTLLPGFRNTPYVFGLDDGFNSPGIPFLLGSQDPGIRSTAVENDWLVGGQLTMPFQQNQLENIGVQATIEPFRDFRVQVDFKKTVTSSYQEIFNIQNGEYTALNPARSGNYDLTYLTIRTAFDQNDAENNSETFRNFEANRDIIFERLTGENPVDTANYQLNSQDVLIPAFLAAYSGQDVNSVDLSPFPRLPLPNWRVDYAGLPRLFPSLTDAFSSLTLSHAYTSNYSVSNYTNSLQYTDDLELNNRTTDYPLASVASDSGFFVPTYVVQQVTITERFAPLIGINIRTKGRLSGRISYDRERSLALNMSNAQVTELTSQAITVNLGFIKKGFKLPFRVQGRTISLKNDLTFNMAVAFKDTETVQRKIGDDNTITNGNLNFQVRPTVDYRASERLNVQLYFSRTVNEPKITNSFRRTTSEFGTQVRFNLAQ